MTSEYFVKPLPSAKTVPCGQNLKSMSMYMFYRSDTYQCIVQMTGATVMTRNIKLVLVKLHNIVVKFCSNLVVTCS